MDTDGIAEGIYASVPDVFDDLLRGNNTVLVKEKVFQKTAFFAGEGNGSPIDTGFSGTCVKCEDIPF